MKDNRRTEIKVGLMTLIGIIVFLLILVWAKGIDFSDNKIYALVEFNNVAGLEIGDAVMVNGVKKGKVNDIKPNKNMVIVHLTLDEGTQIYDDAQFSIMMLDLMGGKKVEVNPGNNGIFDPEKIHTGKFLGDISTAMAMLSSVQEDLVAMTREIRITLEKTNEILSDDQFTLGLRESVTKLNQLMGSLNKFMNDNKDDLDTLIVHTKTFVGKSRQFIENNDEKMSRFISSSTEIVENANTLVNKLNNFVDDINKQENNFGKLLHDETLFNDLKEMLKKVDEMTSVILEQLQNNGLKVEADVDLF